MEDKINRSVDIIHSIAKEYKNPIIYCGFGKDSICVLHLCRTLGYNWPVMFHREPFFPIKYRYANRIIELWNLMVYDYPPKFMSLFFHHGVFEIVQNYQLGYSYLAMCAILYEPENVGAERYICAYRDLILRPKGVMDIPWDVGIQGFRYQESKPHSGGNPSKLIWERKLNPGSLDIAFPIRDWSNQEVYHYIVDKGIPINWDVYEVENDELVPKADWTYNPDRRAACFRCVDPRYAGQGVMCPRTNCLTSNFSELVPKAEMPNDFPGCKE